MFILTFGRFNNEKRYLSVSQFREQLINSVGFAGAGGTGDKGVGSEALLVDADSSTFCSAHVKDMAKIDS